MPSYNPITAYMLRNEYFRVELRWLYDNGFGDYNKIVFMHENRRTILIGLQKPEAREVGQPQNFIMWFDGVEAYYQYEQEGKAKWRDNDNNGVSTRQIRVFLIDEDFDWKFEDYPTDRQILAGGKTETLENIRKKVIANKDRIVTDKATGRTFFLDFDFNPRVKVGRSPDDLNNGDTPRPRRVRGFDDPSNDEESRQKARERLNRTGSSSVDFVEIRISDGTRTVNMRLKDVTFNEVLETFENAYGRASSMPPF